MRFLSRAPVGLVAGIVLVLGAPASLFAQDRPPVAMDGQWHFMVAPYLWFSALNGTVSVRNLPDVPIDESFSDIWEDFHFGALVRFEGRKNRWGFATDVMYIDLHAAVAQSAPVLAALDAEATVKSFTLEGAGLYRVVTGGRKDNPGFVDVLAGARYSKMSNQLNAVLPLGDQLVGDKKDIDWVDAVAGLRFRAPLGSRFGFIGRADIAGFGSKFTWNLEGDLAADLSEHWMLGAGWRHLSIDYEKGSGIDSDVLDLAYDGPRIWFAYVW